MRIACLQHVPFEGPGTIATWAVERGHTVVETLMGRDVLPALAAFDMLVVLGGPMGANDTAEHHWLTPEKELIARAVGDGKLVLGVCLGAQLLATSLGGGVFRGEESEIGWFPVSLTSAGEAHPVFGAWPETFMAGHWHRDVFAPPKGILIAAVSEACPSQAFATPDGRAVGMQFHLEWTQDSIRGLADTCGSDLVASAHVQPADSLLARLDLLEQVREALFALLDKMEALP